MAPRRAGPWPELGRNMRQGKSGDARARLLRTVVAVSLSAIVLTACMEEAAAPGAGAARAGIDDGESEMAVMPDVVCLDLQEAQDTIQETGVFLSKSTDATGEGRKQIIDRNWVVVEQSPVAGTLIGEGEAVLSVVKDDEPSICNGEATAELAAAAPSTTVAPTTTSTTAAPTTTSAPTTVATTTTAAPTTVVLSPPATTTAVAVQPFIPQECHPSYEGACVPFAEDVDCAGGSGNGPAYVRGPVRIVGPDEYGLDGNDNDGVGCES